MSDKVDVLTPEEEQMYAQLIEQVKDFKKQIEETISNAPVKNGEDLRRVTVFLRLANESTESIEAMQGILRLNKYNKELLEEINGSQL